MRVQCILTASELTQESEVIVLPEYVSPTELRKTCATFPHAFVVSAVEESDASVGRILRGREPLAAYVKMETDARTTGSNNVDQMPIYDDGVICIGVVACKDVDNIRFFGTVTQRIRSSTSRHKILCIPADMGSEWLHDEVLPEKYHGMYVVLCNNVYTHQARCKSFIANDMGQKIIVQRDREPIFVRWN